MGNKRACTRIALMLFTLAVAPLLSGCGNFWQAPSNTNTGTTASSVTLTPSPTSAIAGASVTLTAAVVPSAATGTVTFYNGSTSLGPGTLSSGTATLTTSFPTAGTQSLTAKYGGDSTYAASTSSAVSFVVSAVTGTTTNSVELTPTSAIVGESVTLTATDSASAATGTVTFYNGLRPLGTGMLNSGTATLIYTFTTAGTLTLTADYSGDETYAASNSPAVDFTVQ